MRLDIQIEKEVAKSDRFDRIRDDIERRWPRRPGVQMLLTERNESGRGGSGRADETKQRNFVVRLYGRDTDYLVRLAEQFRTEIEALPEVDNVDVPQLDDSKEVVVTYDRDRLQELGVQPAMVHAITSSGLQGRSLSRFDEKGRETQLIIEFDSSRNPTLLDLKETQIMRPDGTTQRLADVADVAFQPSTGTIRRDDGKINVTLIGRRRAEVSPQEMASALNALMRSNPLPRGYTWSQESAFRQAEEDLSVLFAALLLGVVLVFLLMGVLFESVILPGSILFTIPFALLGALASLRLFHGELDIMCFVGGILLCGIVVNNGIVLLDCIHRLRESGVDRAEAILRGTRQRLRPIVMTATTTIVGLLPMAVFGDSTGGGVSYKGMSIAVAGGLTVCTVFTAFVVPLVYTLLDDLRIWWAGCWRRALGAPRAGRTDSDAPGGGTAPTGALANADPQR